MTSASRRAITWCDGCRKWLFTDRKSARKAIRERRYEQGLRAYECPLLDGWWHIGHLPPATVYGLKTAAEVYRSSA